jgi:hexokinase
MASFSPTPSAVYSARAILATFNLPNELILYILDQASYWVERHHECTEFKVLMDEDFSTGFTAAYPYLQVPAFSTNSPMDTETPKIKEIEFTIVSHGKPREPAGMMLLR